MEPLTIIIITLILSAFFSGMEIAFVSANKLKIEVDKKKGLRSGKILAGFVKNPSKFLSTLLLGNNFALVLYGIAMAKLISPYIEKFLGVYAGRYSVLFIQTMIATLVILITAEFIPKTLFRINPNGILRVFAVPLNLFYILFYPVIYLFISSSRFILKHVFHLKMEEDSYTFTPMDLDMYIDDFSQQDEEEQEEGSVVETQFMKNAIDFRDVKLRECIVPRPEVVAVEEHEDIELLRSKFVESGFSRILIYREDIDEIIGYCHASDMFKRPRKITDIIRDIDFYPETILAKEVLRRLIRKGQSIAVVVDEWGGTSGIVTIEDIIEEIFGEIEDEFDDEGLIEEYHPEKDCFLLSTRHEIDYLNEKYKLDIPESDAYETLGGFIISHFERIPAEGEKLTVEDFTILVKKATPVMLELVCLKKMNQKIEE